MSNWCPISLLNTDLKIASASIANRFKQVLGCINSDAQKGIRHALRFPCLLLVLGCFLYKLNQIPK
jgi:hypothetical protein